MVHTKKQMNWQGSAETLVGPMAALEPGRTRGSRQLPSSWRVAGDESPAYSRKATSGPQGVIAIKAHTVPQSLFAILLKETLDFGAFQIQSGFKLVLSLTSLKKQAFAL